MSEPVSPNVNTGAAKADQWIEAGRKMFRAPVTFILGAADLSQIPDTDMPEVAFAGRSNVGKSSLINALFERKSVARTSNTPGRTREVNFFDLSGRLMLADLPGYGYARAPKTEIERWTRLIENYLKGRQPLRRTFLLVDSRHGLKPSDDTLMDLLDVAAVNYQVILTKADKVKAQALETCREKVAGALRTRAAAHPTVLVTSSHDQSGLDQLRGELAMLAEQGKSG